MSYLERTVVCFVSQRLICLYLRACSNYVTVSDESGHLWVDQYAPVKYTDLLSDEVIILYTYFILTLYLPYTYFILTLCLLYTYPILTLYLLYT